MDSWPTGSMPAQAATRRESSPSASVPEEKSRDRDSAAAAASAGADGKAGQSLARWVARRGSMLNIQGVRRLLWNAVPWNVPQIGHVVAD